MLHPAALEALGQVQQLLLFVCYQVLLCCQPSAVLGHSFLFVKSWPAIVEFVVHHHCWFIGCM